MSETVRLNSVGLDITIESYKSRLLANVSTLGIKESFRF